MSSLLEKTRAINRLLQRSESVEYDGISRVLSNVLNANVYITDKRGKIFGYAFLDDFECDMMIDKVIDQGEFPKTYVNWLMRITDTRANLKSKTGMCAYDDTLKCLFNGKNTTIVPIYGVGTRIGTLIVARYDGDFNEDDILLCEYGATVVGMEMLRDHAEKAEIEARKKATVEIAIHSLSHSERRAVVAIFSALHGTKGVLVASKIADEVGITRSVIVNALRKFQSANIIKAESMGMKGTRIIVHNEYLLDAIQNLDLDD